MSLLAKISTATDDRSARLAGVGLMLLSVAMFSFGDALGKFIVATYPDVTQFWTYDKAAFLKNPVYSRDYPPAKNLEQ